MKAFIAVAVLWARFTNKAIDLACDGMNEWWKDHARE